MTCVHMNFAGHIAVARLEDSGRFNADITIKCADCGLPFQFKGLAPGLNLNGAAVSVDGLQARLAIVPQGAEPNPMQAIMLSGQKFDA
jgi:hypothetical protein